MLGMVLHAQISMNVMMEPTHVTAMLTVQMSLQGLAVHAEWASLGMGSAVEVKLILII